MSFEDIYFGVTYSGRVEDSLRAAANRAEAAGRLSEVADYVVFPVRVARWAGF